MYTSYLGSGEMDGPGAHGAMLKSSAEWEVREDGRNWRFARQIHLHRFKMALKWLRAHCWPGTHRSWFYPLYCQKNEKLGLGEGGRRASRQQSGSPALSIQTCCVRTMVATKLQIDMEGQLLVRGRGAGGSVWTT